MTDTLAPELDVSEWLNAQAPITLESLRGKVVLVKAFQMLCPGCVSHSLPQAKNARQMFSPDDLAVLGLHTVFEHHSAQGTREALEAFMHEYRINFPVGIDTQSSHNRLPKTMSRYNMQGTPTLLLIDRHGHLRRQKFGQVHDMVLGAEIMALIGESGPDLQTDDANKQSEEGCDENGCPVPKK